MQQTGFSKKHYSLPETSSINSNGVYVQAKQFHYILDYFYESSVLLKKI